MSEWVYDVCSVVGLCGLYNDDRMSEWVYDVCSVVGLCGLYSDDRMSEWVYDVCSVVGLCGLYNDDRMSEWVYDVCSVVGLCGLYNDDRMSEWVYGVCSVVGLCGLYDDDSSNDLSKRAGGVSGESGRFPNQFSKSWRYTLNCQVSRQLFEHSLMTTFSCLYAWYHAKLLQFCTPTFQQCLTLIYNNNLSLDLSFNVINKTLSISDNQSLYILTCVIPAELK